MLKEIADRLHADVGDTIVFFEENGKIVIEKA
ncbi:MAG: AbrB/MazE/SpoVT family DNA-binding domain-containing protein [Candidatus Methanoperedens sp.]|nr:AbrB/MazE/SpoVT family DNA-binding domain-containing protein [Candidatus Methanoperedens nitroreducens]MDJ1422704.1 AbrB/MazE/SpoVT family DNA-binding domain-containing protein [Candidatus Methanoperedens sp.]